MTASAILYRRRDVLVGCRVFFIVMTVVSLAATSATISIPQPSDFVPLQMGFIVSVHRPVNITLLTLVQTGFKGSRRSMSLMRTHTQ